MKAEFLHCTKCRHSWRQDIAAAPCPRCSSDAPHEAQCDVCYTHSAVSVQVCAACAGRAKKHREADVGVGTCKARKRVNMQMDIDSGGVCGFCERRERRGKADQTSEATKDRLTLLLDAAIRAKDQQMSVMNDEIEWLRRVVERALPVGKGPSDGSSS